MIRKIIYIAALTLLSQIAFSSISNIPAGVIIDTIKCLSDTSSSYSVYVPSNYTTEKNWPVLFGFDPSANGRIPIEKYYELAEKYGFIITCSNNAKNGAWDTAIKSAQIMIDDINQRFSIDPSRMCAYGFSGGGRLASLIAIENKTISAVINCGAGFPNNSNPNYYFKFQYINIIGLRDFNYIEIMGLDKQLAKLGVNYSIIPFDEGHLWPKKEIFEEAILHLILRDYKNNPSSESYNFLYNHYKYLFNCLDETFLIPIKEYMYTFLIDIEKILNVASTSSTIKYQNFFESNEFLDYSKLKSNAIPIERNFQREVISEMSQVYSFSAESKMFRKTWWKHKINAINHYISDTNTYYKYMGERLKNYVFISAHESMNSLDSSNYSSLLNLNYILKLCYPNNYYPNYNAASIYARMGDINKCYKELKLAREKGFVDMKIILNDPDFEKIRDSKKIQELFIQN